MLGPVGRLVMLLLAVVVLGSSCARERLYGERSPTGKFYHNLTSHYNGWFNANELLLQAEDELEASAKTDYTEILPVYPAYASASAAAAAPALDKAMEKVSLVVNIHRPSDFDDDSYLLLGRAQLLKQDYESAQHTFEYSIKEFDPENEADRLRRIEKHRIADQKAEDKANKVRGGSSGRKPATRRSTAPQRRKSSASRTKRKPSSSSRSGSSRSGSSTKSAASKKLPKKKGKKKTRAEMAREQREAKLAAAKEEARAEERAAREAAEAEQKAAEVAAKKAAQLEAGVVPDAEAALDDGKGLASITTDEKRPKHGIFIHEDAQQDFQYWLARTYIARDRYVDAERVLGKLARSGSTFKRIRRQLPGAYADM